MGNKKTIVRAKIIICFLFLITICNYLHPNENEMWDFSKRTPIEEKEKKFLTGKVSLLGTIKVYQLILSDQQGDACNFTPSCSHYAYEAIKKWGVIKGSLMAIDRLQRCNPWAWDYLNTYYKVKWVKDKGYKLSDPPHPKWRIPNKRRNPKPKQHSARINGKGQNSTKFNNKG